MEEESYWDSLLSDPMFDQNVDPDWLSEFMADERQNNELNWCLLYDAGFKHGTDGHHKLLLVARLTNLVDVAWRLLSPEQRDIVREVFLARQSNGDSA